MTIADSLTKESSLEKKQNLRDSIQKKNQMIKELQGRLGTLEKDYGSSSFSPSTLSNANKIIEVCSYTVRRLDLIELFR